MSRLRTKFSAAWRTLAAVGSVAAVLFAPAPAAVAATGVPTQSTIIEGVGAGGLTLGMTKTQALSLWGQPVSCGVTRTRETCRFRSPDGAANPLVAFTGTPRRVSLITIYNDTPGWTTTKGIKIASSAAPSLTFTPPQELEQAYAGQIDMSRSTYYSRVVPGTDALGRASTTRFTVGWFAEYTPDQFFGVTAITVSTP